MPFAIVSCGGEEPDNPNNNSENHENSGNNNGGGNGDNNETIINYYFNSGSVRISPDAGNVSIYIDSNTWIFIIWPNKRNGKSTFGSIIFKSA